MTVDEFLPHLDAVRRSSRGWVARCPAHPDRHPSLAIKEGDKGLLVRCWSGCDIEHIVGALGLTVRDLFFDNEADPREWMQAQRIRKAERTRKHETDHLVGLSIDATREAKRLDQSARNINIESWTDAQLNSALNRLADAYHLLEMEQVHG